MKELKEIILEFRNQQLNTYQNDPIRITRDYNSVQRSVKDHANRWLFELIQNCDDEGATVVDIRVEKQAIYVADNGNGFKPEAVVSISGTDFSDKPAGMIGRKGVGFKSVYQIADNPKVFSNENEGLEFNRTKTQTWFEKNDLPFEEKQLPYQWIPFFLSRKESEKKDSILFDLNSMNTVVVLPFKSKKARKEALDTVIKWPSHTLFPFNHIQILHFQSEETSFEIRVNRKETIWKLSDTRNGSKAEWKVHKSTLSTPKKILRTLGPEDQKYVKDISFLVAAPIEDNLVSPIKEYLPLHVFYPTKTPSPVRLLLHGEFLVKGDRTSLLPIDSSEFNNWVADELAKFIIKFVNDSYDKQNPSEFLRLLVPITETQVDTTEILWSKILSYAKEKLLLPNSKGNQILTIPKCHVLSVSVRPDISRDILSTTSITQYLLHTSIDENNEVRKTLNELGCNKVTDQSLISIVKNNIPANKNNEEWIWNCWKWLAAWTTDKSTYSDDYDKRIEQIESIQLLPISENLLSKSDLEGNEINWNPLNNTPQIPSWLPLKFLDNWFQKRLSDLHERDPIIRLLNELNIVQYKDASLKQALKHALNDYWARPDNNPERFLEFLSSEQGKKLEDLQKLSDCPIPARIDNTNKVQWIRAEKAYLGHEWGHKLIEIVFNDVDGIAWALSWENNPKNRQQDLYKSLGCTHYPKIVEKNFRKKRFQDFPKECQNWLNKGFVRKNGTESIDAIKSLDKISIGDLSINSATALLRLIVKNWDSYYWEKSRTWYRWIPRTRESRKSVDSYWKFQIKYDLTPKIIENFAIPKPLSKCWLPSDDTRKAIGYFLPILDIDIFAEDKKEVKEWLISTMRLRQEISQVTIDEWYEIIANKIPELINNQDQLEKSLIKDIILQSYEASVESLEGKPTKIHNKFSDIPLLCRKGSSWNLIAANDAFLADNPELSKAFNAECWQIDFSQKNKNRAKSVFGLNLLSEKVDQTLTPGMENQEKTTLISNQISTILPFVFASRCSVTQEDSEKVEAKLRSYNFKAVDSLKALLELKNWQKKEVTKDYGIENNTIYINVNSSTKYLPPVALALADAIGVKTEADFFENLLRCKTDEERIGKLSSKGLTKEIIERYIREFRSNKVLPIDKHLATTASQNNDAGKTVDRKSDQSQNNQSANNSKRHQKESSKDAANRRSPTKPVAPKLSLKDLSSEGIIFASEYSNRSYNSSSSSQTTKKITSQNQLSHEEKLEIEKRGREAAAIKLNENGYQVNQMPQDNPGFDIKAQKNGKELIIEIKAHRNLSNNIEISQRQIMEYTRNQDKENVSWELWNVENLSNHASGPVKITRYSSLPEETWRTRVVTINLKECHPIEEGLQ